MIIKFCIILTLLGLSQGEPPEAQFKSLFKLGESTTPVDNPYLDTILKYLGRNNIPFQRYKIEPLPLSLLAPCFSRSYFSYVGSLTQPPCIEGVRWIVQPEPLCISCRQMKILRKTPMLYCYLKNNTRPVQELNSREVIFYD